ncbi:MAG: 50S ribosomal protein L25/general stress protein Ctc [Gemmatimonas sp.]
MAAAKLDATLRSESGKGAARALRRAGSIPGVIYGHGRQPQSLTVNARETERLLSHIAAGSTVIELNLNNTVARTLIREIQRHPFKRNILHIDFQELVAGETITVRCPIVYIGTPEGVRMDGGILDQIMHEISIMVDPSSIPNHIDVDVSALKVGQSLHVSDVKLPAGVKSADDATLTVCVVQQPKTAPETTTEAAAEPEVTRQKKAEEDKK